MRANVYRCVLSALLVSIMAGCGETSTTHVPETAPATSWNQTLSVVVQGPFEMRSFDFCTWQSTVYNAAYPVSFSWERDWVEVGTQSVYSTDHASGGFYLKLTVTDALNRTASDLRWVWEDASAPNCPWQ